MLDALDRLRDTASSHERAFLIEVMGRNCGYLALMGGILGGAEITLIPERDMELEEIGTRMEDAYLRGKNHAIAIIAEGSKHKINDVAAYLESHQLGFEVRVTILGHVQRGGSPTAFDRLLATRMGIKAVECILSGTHGIMVGLNGRDISPVSLEDVTTKTRAANMEYYDLADVLSR
jgi:6-phosphofructokinase 1